jgi:hypothetical protein
MKKKINLFFPFETCNLDGVKSSPNCIEGSCHVQLLLKLYKTIFVKHTADFDSENGQRY